MKISIRQLGKCKMEEIFQENCTKCYLYLGDIYNLDIVWDSHKTAWGFIWLFFRPIPTRYKTFDAYRSIIGFPVLTWKESGVIVWWRGAVLSARPWQTSLKILLQWHLLLRHAHLELLRLSLWVREFAEAVIEDASTASPIVASAGLVLVGPLALAIIKSSRLCTSASPFA